MFRSLPCLALALLVPFAACDVGDVEDANEFEVIEENIANGVASTASHDSVGYILRNGNGHCTGTYMGSKLVLTAAHCLRDRDVTTFEVGWGKRSDGKKFDVVEGWMHPDYEQGKADHDIAILKIDSYPGVTVARIGRTTGGCSLHSIGYGKNDDGGSGDRLLASRCLEDIDGGRVIHTPNPRRISGLCGGDSGGGLMVAAKPNTIRGVHSRSRKGCEEDEPNATAVNLYEADNQDWLEGFSIIRWR